ncbi:MAG TPA: hypothetical protein VFV49_05445 [Thermoanaerobaculia bacterium]|nr:hypothetical protein [Thermoanaerobaculia bacterium]
MSNAHFTQDEFILAYYGEPDARREHLDSCEACRAELAKLAGVLDRVTPDEVPEPAEDYEARVWDRVSWRLRGERKRTSREWQKWVAAAAMLAFAFIGGLLWNRRNTGPVQIANQPSATSAAQPVAASTQQQRDRILLVVVGDHLDDSERMLLELTNLTAKTDVDVTTEQQRAEELLVSNRLYRRTALDRGEDRVATLLDELEPVLMQIAHGPSQMTPEELRKVQKRVETKGLVFKLRVLRADVRATSVPHLPTPNI